MITGDPKLTDWVEDIERRVQAVERKLDDLAMIVPELRKVADARMRNVDRILKLVEILYYRSGGASGGSGGGGA